MFLYIHMCSCSSLQNESQEMQANSLLTAHTSIYNVWKKLPSLQYKFSALCIIDGVIVAIGGIDSAGRIKTSSVYALSTSTMMWRRVGDLHFPCVCLGIVLPNSELLCMEKGAGTRIFKGKANGRIGQVGTSGLKQTEVCFSACIYIVLTH